MQLVINQEDIEEAIEEWVTRRLTVSVEPNIKLKATRGDEGYQATIDIGKLEPTAETGDAPVTTGPKPTPTLPNVTDPTPVNLGSPTPVPAPTPVAQAPEQPEFNWEPVNQAVDQVENQNEALASVAETTPVAVEQTEVTETTSSEQMTADARENLGLGQEPVTTVTATPAELEAQNPVNVVQLNRPPRTPQEAREYMEKQNALDGITGDEEDETQKDGDNADSVEVSQTSQELVNTNVVEKAPEQVVADEINPRPPIRDLFKNIQRKTNPEA